MKTKDQFQRELGLNLRKLRLEKSWTIEKLALETGLTYSQLGRIELGRRNPTAFTLYIISNTLRVNAAEIFKLEEVIK